MKGFFDLKGLIQTIEGFGYHYSGIDFLKVSEYIQLLLQH